MPKKIRNKQHEDKTILSPMEGPTENTTTLGFWPMSNSVVLDNGKEKDKSNNKDKLT